MRPCDRDLSFRLRVLWACGMLPGDAKRISTNKIYWAVIILAP